MPATAFNAEAFACAASMELPLVSLNTLSSYVNTSPLIPLEHSVLIAENDPYLLIGVSNPKQYLTALSYWQEKTPHHIRCVWVSEMDRASLMHQQCKTQWEHLLKSDLWKKHIPELALFCCLHADHKRATDLQLLTQEQHDQLTLRIDGIRESMFTLPKGAGKRLMRHWMLESHLDNTQRLQPQDGCLLIQHHRPYRFRINACPTDKGRSLAIRLPRRRVSFCLESLKLETEQKYLLLDILNQKQGLLIVTGPTGSGKTESLYCFLTYLVNASQHVVTLEDPVEHELQGVTQIPVRGDTRLSYRAAIKNTLRQDPDAIMIGEIRDDETASIALEAAQTGHLVLASCHTNHTLATCERLKQLHVSLRDLSHIKTVILAQRLVRTLCPFCFEKKSRGCLQCQNGYRGRRAVFECLNLSNKLIDAIEHKRSHHALRDIAEKQHTSWLNEHADRLVASGITTAAECRRTLGDLFSNRWGCSDE